VACQLDGFGRKQVKRCGPGAAVGLLGMLPEAKARAANSGNRPLPRFYLLCPIGTPLEQRKGHERKEAFQMT